MRTDTPKTIYLKDYTPAPFLVEHMDLSFDLREDNTTVVSTVRYKKNPEGVSSNLTLNGEHQKLISVSIDGEAYSDYETTDKGMVIKDAGDAFTLVVTSEVDPEGNTSLEGLY